MKDISDAVTRDESVRAQYARGESIDSALLEEVRMNTNTMRWQDLTLARVQALRGNLADADYRYGLAQRAYCAKQDKPRPMGKL